MNWLDTVLTCFALSARSPDLREERTIALIYRIAALTALIAVLGCGKEDSSNTITVVTDATYRPFEFYDENRELVGYDIDLFRAIGEIAGFEVKFKHQAFDGGLAGLRTGKFDAMISAMTITEERQKTFLFSDPYYNAAQVVAVREDETEIKSFEDLAGRVIGTQRGTTGYFKATEVPNAKALEYDTIELAFTALQNRSVEAVINDEPTSRAIAQKRGGVKLVGGPLTKEQYGIAMMKGSEALAERINAALKQLKENGELDRLHQKWIVDAP